jgi:hypothetical protein
VVLRPTALRDFKRPDGRYGSFASFPPSRRVRFAPKADIVQPNRLDQVRDGKVQPIIWPADAKTGHLIYPYADAKKK